MNTWSVRTISSETEEIFDLIYFEIILILMRFYTSMKEKINKCELRWEDFPSTRKRPFHRLGSTTKRMRTQLVYHLSLYSAS